MKKIFIVIIAIMTATHAVCGQNFIEDAVRSDGILPAEISKFSFSNAGNVDFRGDHNISIPVMTVPGRGGLDFPLTLSYKSGIKTTDKASWVGLGWSLETGSISRTVNCFPDFAGYRNTDYYQDSLEGPDTYHISVPGLGSSSIIRTEQGFFPQDWRNWKILSSLPIDFQNKRKYTSTHCSYDVFGSISTQLLRIGEIEQILSCDLSGGLNKNSFNVNLISRNYKDITFFKIIDERGYTYVFGRPLRSDMEAYHIVTEYVSNWRLTAILSPDYVDQEPCSGLVPVPGDEDLGNWIRFEYGNVSDVRPYINGAQNLYDNERHALLTEVIYLDKIITPTHEAVFKMSPIWDISYLAPYANTHPDIANNMYGTTCLYDTNGTFTGIFRPMRLDTIVLYNICGTSPVLVSKTVFEYASQDSELCRYTRGPIDSVDIQGASYYLIGKGKSTLKKVYFTDYAGNIQPGYSFKYTDKIDNFNPPYSGQFGSSANPLVPYK